MAYGPDNPVEYAKQLVFEWYSTNIPFGDIPFVKREDIRLVWFSKTLQNWKAMLITTAPDAYFYEVTYNGDKKEAYLDEYRKTTNQVIPDPIHPYLKA